MQYFRFHFYDGQAPVQVYAESRDAAEATVRAQHGSNFTFAGSGSTSQEGYTNVGGSADTPARPGGDTFGGPGQAIGGVDEATRQSFMSQFRRGLDSQPGMSGANPFRGFLNRQAEPALDVFATRSALGQERGTPQEFVANLFGGPGSLSGGITRAASEAWQELLNQKAGGTAPSTNYFLDPDETLSGDDATQLGNVANRAARSKYGTWGASFLPSASEQYQRYLAQPEDAPGSQRNLIDFFNRRVFGR